MADELKRSLQKFGESRNSLEHFLGNVKRAYGELNKILEKQRRGSRTTLDIQSLLLTEDEEKSVRTVLQEPKIVVVGQTNSGKSSLINELLGATVVTVDDIPCTARIVELQNGQSEMPFIEVVRKDGKVIVRKQLDKKFVPSGVINLTEDDRKDSDMIDSIVRIKIKNDFLESGIQILDSPGKNEYKELDELISKHMDSVLPLVVYVIDGKGLLTLQEIEDIRSLTRRVPEGNIFYVVTKCDSPKQMERDDNDSSDDDDDEVKDKTKRSNMEKSIRNTVYRKLVEENFLDDRRIDRCTNYHTLSSRYVKKYRRAKQTKKPTEQTRKIMRECQRFMDDFENFKTNLFQFTSRQLMRTVISATNVLITSVLKCLDYFMDTSNKLYNDRRENERNIQLIESEELRLGAQLIAEVKKSQKEFEGVISGLMRHKRDLIIKMSTEFRYVEFQVPADGYVDSSKVEICQKELKNKILTKVGELIHEEILKNCAKIDEIFEEVEAKVKTVQEKLGSDINIHDALQQMFVRNYKFDVKGVKLTKSLWKRIVDFMKSAFSVITLIPVIIRAIRGVKVTDDGWKRKVAENVLDSLQPSALSEVIVDGICHHIIEGHEKFVTQLENVKMIHAERHRLGENDRQMIRQLAPLMARLLLIGWDITDRQRFGKPNYGRLLGEGAQGKVYTCDVRGPNGEDCVAKVIQADTNMILGDLAMEMHYSRKLNHRHLAPIFGSMYDELGNDRYEVVIIMPRYKCDVLQILPKLTSLKERMLIALQVAQALVYIHRLGLMHRDIKCNNILLDENHNAKLTDYGLCKPPAMAMGSVVGTPIHMAPEIVTDKEYDTKVDVYSFGILLWYLCEGKGNHPDLPNVGGIGGMLLLTALGRRPERLRGMTDDCWELMEACWQGDPQQRPAMDIVVKRLEKIVKKVR